MFPRVPASSPEALSVAFADAINSRDLSAALELWTADAAIVGPNGNGARGRAAIEDALRALVDHRVTLAIDVASIHTAGDIALATGTFTVSGTDADGARFSSQSTSLVVYTRAPDGWRIAIDAPWGLPQD
jgi:uncharacterized protein (TIGR02246 family)